MKKNPRTYFPIAILALVLMPVVSIGVLTITDSFRVVELKKYGEVPWFSMTERSGLTLKSEDLRGKVWIASFIFTHCAGQCPVLTAKVAKISSRLRFKENFRTVSFTVDPERDTPEVLSDYANKYNADPFKWFFVTGKKGEMQSLLQHGFRLASSEPDFGGDIVHSFKLVLVDSNMMIRGYYDGLEDDGIKEALRDARSLIRKSY